MGRCRKQDKAQLSNPRKRIVSHTSNAPQLTPAHAVVLVEGNYLSLSLPPWNTLRGDMFFDLRWHIACPPDVARARVIARHVSTGSSVEQATRRADENDVPNGALVEAETARGGWATRVVQSM